ncbi:MAG: SusC/RagA family protein [Flavobacteria bacterium RIFCSPLOWO2_12_FULL_35_11]|nr:MAG: SusC/RagA family protein [Flavobacteria bacterium RIFCSPLOWO2_12_FULL_35_11]
MKTKLNGFLTLLLALMVQISFAQEKTVTGKVTDGSGPLPGVTVLIKGTKAGTQTDFDGNYSIRANTGAVLQFSFVGMKTVDQAIGASNTINIVMQEDAQSLDEVVVTALGIKREKKSLGYATQEVKGDAVNTVKDPNFVNSLSGKIAGIDVKSSGTMGGSTNVIIRGYSSLFGNNQALFVIDGVPVSNLNTNSGGQTTGRGGYDFGNAAQDINPDDIESINVLKGGAATALYGSRAANGVVVITTKKGAGVVKQGIGVTVNSSVTFNKFNEDTFTKYQNEYGAGYFNGWHPGGFYFEDQDGDGTDEAYALSDWDGSFGTVPFDSNLLVHQWNSWYPQLPDTYGVATPWVAGKNGPASVFETGTTLFNSVGIDGGNEQGTFRLAYTKLDQKGIMPNSSIIRDNVDFSGSYKLNEKLTAAAKVTYVKTAGKGRYGTGYDSENFMQTAKQWWQTNVDVKEQKAAYFLTRENITWNTSYINHDLSAIYHDNVYFMRYENFETDLRNRVFGNASLNYEINDWLSIFGRVSFDTYSGNQEERIANGSTNSPSKYSIFNESFNENNYDLMVNFDKDIAENLNFKAVIGTNVMRQNYSSIFASTNGGLNVDRLYALRNSKNPINAPTQREYLMGVDGYYANASLGFDNMIYVEGSYRMDIASTLPTDDNKYSYYGVSGSLLFSELIESNLMSFGKLRVGYAKTGNAAGPLQLYNTYDLNTPVAGNASASLPSTNNNSNLTNEESNEAEIGLEMKFAKNRLGFDISLYDKKSKDLLTPVTVTPAIGYSGQWLNAGEVQNKGIEISLSGSPVKTDNFEWKIDVNWGKNESEVLSLASGLENLQLASLQGGVSINASVGEPYGMIRGTDYVYHENGGRLINQTTGAYVKSGPNENLGTFQADWKGGINNSIRYKDLSFSFLVDMQKGGKVFSLDTWYGFATGLTPETAGLNDLGNPMRLTLAEGGGILLDGVKEDGTPNTVRTRMDYYSNALGYGKAVNAQHVYDAGYIKLREVSLAYTLPNKFLKNTFIQGLTLSAIGRNLWIIDKSLPYGDPEAGLSSGNVQGYQSGAYPSTKDYGFSVKLQF